MNYVTKVRASEIAVKMNAESTGLEAFVVYHRDGYWTIIRAAHISQVFSFGQVFSV